MVLSASGEGFRPSATEARQDEPIDRISRPAGDIGLWNLGATGGSKGPVSFPRRPLFDPFFDQGKLARGKALVALGIGHSVVGIGGDDPTIQFALIGLIGDDGPDIFFEGIEKTIFGVDAEIGFALGGIGAMTGIAVVRKDWADIAVELNAIGEGSRIRDGERGDGKRGGGENGNESQQQ